MIQLMVCRKQLNKWQSSWVDSSTKTTCICLFMVEFSFINLKTKKVCYFKLHRSYASSLFYTFYKSMLIKIYSIQMRTMKLTLIISNLGEKNLKWTQHKQFTRYFFNWVCSDSFGCAQWPVFWLLTQWVWYSGSILNVQQLSRPTTLRLWPSYSLWWIL